MFFFTLFPHSQNSQECTICVPLEDPRPRHRLRPAGSHSLRCPHKKTQHSTTVPTTLFLVFNHRRLFINRLITLTLLFRFRPIHHFFCEYSHSFWNKHQNLVCIHAYKILYTFLYALLCLCFARRYMLAHFLFLPFQTKVFTACIKKNRQDRTAG